MTNTGRNDGDLMDCTESVLESTGGSSRSDRTGRSFWSGSLRQILDDASASGGTASDEQGSITDGRAGNPSSGEDDTHAERQSRIPPLDVEKDPSTKTLPSSSTSYEDRTGAEGKSLLRPACESYDSFGTTTNVSGTIASSVVDSRDVVADEREEGNAASLSVKFRDGSKGILKRYGDDESDVELAEDKKRSGPGSLSVRKDEDEEKGTTAPTERRRKKSRGLSIFSIFRTYSEADDLADDITETESSSKGGSKWSFLRRRKTSLLFLPKRLLSSFDEYSVQKDELERLKNCAETGEDMDEQQREMNEHRKEKKTQKLLEKAEQQKRKFDVSLKECMIAIFGYLGLSVLAFSVIFERWPIVDSLYFGVVTFTTAGYGDLSPTTIPGRVFTCFYALGGVASLGIALGVLGSNLLETEINAVRAAQSFRRREVMGMFVVGNQSDKNHQETSGELSSVQFSTPGTWSLIVLLPIIVFLMVGAIFITKVEGWDWCSGLYYTVITMCTIGFGDLAPTLPLSRGFAVCFIPIAVAIVGTILGEVANVIIEQRQSQFRKEWLNFELTPDVLEVMNSRGDGRTTKADYIEFMLLAMEKVDKELMDELHHQFERLDATNSGYLTVDDLKILAKKNLHSARKKLELADYKRGLLAQCRTHSGANDDEAEAPACAQ